MKLYPEEPLPSLSIHETNLWIDREWDNNWYKKEISKINNIKDCNKINEEI